MPTVQGVRLAVTAQSSAVTDRKKRLMRAALSYCAWGCFRYFVWRGWSLTEPTLA